MEEQNKTKARLIVELKETRRHVAELEQNETKRMQAEVALRESEHRYQRLFEDSPISLWEEDFSEVKAYMDTLKTKGVSDFRKYFDENPAELTACAQKVEILDVNKATLVLHQAENKKELLGKLDKTFTEKSFEVFKEELITLAEGRQQFESEAEVKTLSGEHRDIHLRFSVVQAGENGSNYARALVAISDITERKRAEEALRLREQQLSLIYDSTGDILYYLKVEPGPHYRFLTVNNSFLKATGLTVEQIVGKIINEVIPEPALKLVRSNYKKAIQEKRIVYWEETSQYPAGLKTGIVSIAPVFDDKGNCTNLVGSVHDITERKQAEEKLNKANRLYATLSQINQAIVREREKQKLFQEICNIAIEFGKFRLAWIGLVDEENKLVKPVAFSGEGSDYLQNTKISFTNEITGKGPTGRSIREGKSVVFNDLENNPDFAPWREQALEKGYRSSAAFPIRLNNIVIGAFNVYAVEPHFFDADEIKLLKEAAVDISFALEKFEEEENRKRAEEALKGSENKLKEAQRVGKLGHYVFKIATGDWTSSDELDDIFGIDETYQRDVEGWLQIVHPGFAETMANYLQDHVLKQRQKFDKEYKMINIKTKQEKWVHGLGNLKFDENNNPVEMFGTIQDITERKRAEEELKTLGTAIQQSPVSVVITDPQGNIEYVNPKFCEVTGYSAEEVLGKNPRILKSGEMPKEAYEQLWETILAGKEWRGDFHNKKKNGELYWEDVVISAILNENGEITHFLSVKEDITERKRAEERIARFGRIFEDSLNEIYLFEADTLKFTQVNSAAQHNLGYTMEELQKLTPVGLKPEFTTESFAKLIAPLRKGEKEKIVFETVHKRKDQSLYDVEVHLQLLKYEKEALFAAIILDITERKRAEEALRNALAEVEQLKNRLQEENIYLRDEIKVQHQFGSIIGLSDSLKKVLRQVEQVAATDSNVLILGETGTGKELIARGIHEMSLRKERPLVKLNCATLPANLIESELFGHEKGAFTGALSRRIGRFELAHEGTIFLDEIGDLPLDLQVKLLRVLQEGEFERLGSHKTIKVDVRVIAATNRDIEKHVQEGAFREDLFFRLNVFPIYPPPLKDRREDIPLLAKHFIERHNAKLGKQIDVIPTKVMNALQTYDWPGNVRELENIIERAMVISTGSKLELGDWFTGQKGGTAESGPPQTLRETEKQLILETLDRTMWRVSGRGGAAEILGMKPTTLESRMKKLGIKRPK